jgi:hypothetical protein
LYKFYGIKAVFRETGALEQSRLTFMQIGALNSHEEDNLSWQFLPPKVFGVLAAAIKLARRIVALALWQRTFISLTHLLLPLLKSLLIQRYLLLI